MKILPEKLQQGKPALHNGRFNSPVPGQRSPSAASDGPEDYIIEVLELIRTDGRNSVKALVKVRVNQFVFSGVKIVLPILASRPFVAMPSKKDNDEWQPLISVLSPTLAEAINVAVLAAWRKGSAL